MTLTAAPAASIHIELSWPATQLSPNKLQHPMVLYRYKKAAKIEAGWATKLVRPFDWAPPEGDIPIHFIAHPPKNWSTGDADNLVARCKAHLDGIAAVLEVNDSRFRAPTVEWADKCERGKLIVVVG